MIAVKHIEMTGKRFGRVVVLKKNRVEEGGHVFWDAACDCGTHFVVRGSSLRRGITKSCGCLKKEFIESQKRPGREGETRLEKRARIESFGYLSEAFEYSKDTGDLTWKIVFPGRKAGFVVPQNGNAMPYVSLSIEKLCFKAHRLIWVLMTGERPPHGMHIDHIDGDATNNRWNNLRICEPKQNARNSRTPKNSSTGLKGVTKVGSKFRAYICVDRKQIHLGNYRTPEEAHNAYRKSAKEHFGEYACLSR